MEKQIKEALDNLVNSIEVPEYTTVGRVKRTEDIDINNCSFKDLVKRRWEIPNNAILKINPDNKTVYFKWLEKTEVITTQAQRAEFIYNEFHKKAFDVIVEVLRENRCPRPITTNKEKFIHDNLIYNLYLDGDKESMKTIFHIFVK